MASTVVHRHATRLAARSVLLSKPQHFRTIHQTGAAYQEKSSDAVAGASDDKSGQQGKQDQAQTKQKPKKKTIQQMDEEMRMAMAGIEGDGGIAGAELEGGKAVSMKRGVKDNMFRYI